MKKERKEQNELVNQIKDFKRQFRDTLKERLLKERKERHKKGEVFFKGFWVPQNKIEKIQSRLKKRRLAIFFELHLLFFIIFLLNIFIWFVFKTFILP